MDTDLSECAGCLCLASRRAARTITRTFDRELRPHCIRATQFSVLVMLSLQGPMTIGDLAEALGVDRTTLSRNLAAIEANKWVRSRTGDDARSRLVELAPKGTALLTQALPAWRKAQTAAKAAIGEVGVTSLLSLANR